MKWYLLYKRSKSIIQITLIINALQIYAQSSFSQSQRDSAITKAQHYIQQSIDNQSLYYYIVPIIEPLNRYYHLGLTPAASYIKQYPVSEQNLILLFENLIPHQAKKPLKIPEEASLSSIDMALLYSLYGQKVYSRQTYLKNLDSLIQWGGYDLTHAYFSLLLINNTHFLPKKLQNLKLQQTKSLILDMLPDTQGLYSDLDVEVIALLLYGGEILSDRYIRRLIEQQGPEGDFKVFYDDNTVNQAMTDHKTVLALWAMLEWEHIHDKRLFMGE